MTEAKGAAAQPPAANTPTKKESKIAWVLKELWELICEHWFILGLGFAIGFAAAVPNFGRKGGWIAAQWSIKYGAVIIIFFLSGCSLKTKALLTVMARIHVHLFIQCICLVLTPAIGYGIARGLMRTSMNSDLVNGLIVAMVMPTTISTNVVFTKQAGGNEAAALVNAVIGNIIGIFVSPGWLYVYVGKSGHAPYGDVIRQLAITIIAPLVVGQLVQYFFPAYVKAAQDKVNFGKIGNLMIILLVWSTFCDTFYKKIKLAASSWVPMLFLEIGLFFFFSLLCLALSTFAPAKKLFNLDKPDAVAIVMCGSTKTLALGMPLITVVYGKHSNAGILSLPLIIYHASQCLMGSLYIKQLKKWVNGPSPGAWPRSCWPQLDAPPAADGGKALDNSSGCRGDSKDAGTSGSASAAAADGAEAGIGSGQESPARGCNGDAGVRGTSGSRSVEGAAGSPMGQEVDVENGQGSVLVSMESATSNGRTASPGTLPR